MWLSHALEIRTNLPNPRRKSNLALDPVDNTDDGKKKNCAVEVARSTIPLTKPMRTLLNTLFTADTSKMPFRLDAELNLETLNQPRFNNFSKHLNAFLRNLPDLSLILSTMPISIPSSTTKSNAWTIVGKDQWRNAIHILLNVCSSESEN